MNAGASADRSGRAAPWARDLMPLRIWGVRRASSLGPRTLETD